MTTVTQPRTCKSECRCLAPDARVICRLYEVRKRDTGAWAVYPTFGSYVDECSGITLMRPRPRRAQATTKRGAWAIVRKMMQSF